MRRSATAEQSFDEPLRLRTDRGFPLNGGGIEEPAPVLAMRDRALGNEPRKHRLDRRQRPAALDQALGHLGRRKRLRSCPQHLHQVELRVADSLICRHNVYICKRTRLQL